MKGQPHRHRPTFTALFTDRSVSQGILPGGDWGPGVVKLSYWWFRGSSKIAGATHSSYKLTSKDKGKKVTVLVRGSKSGYVSVDKKVTLSIAK